MMKQPMSRSEIDELAGQIVSGSGLALADALGLTGIPKRWQCGPSLEVRLRCGAPEFLAPKRLTEHLRVLGIVGPLLISQLDEEPTDEQLVRVEMDQQKNWGNHEYGWWRLEPVVGVIVTVLTVRPELLLSIPPAFMERFGPWHWGFSPIRALPENCPAVPVHERLVPLLLSTQRYIGWVAASIGDQAWCMRPPNSGGLIIGRNVAEAAGWSGEPDGDRGTVLRVNASE
jgi:hypothetical protein